MAGVFTFFHYGAWFAVLTSVIKEQKYWRYLGWTSLLAAGLMSVYAWMQYFNVNASFVFLSGSDRLSGTLGNAAYFGSYMTMNAFIAALLALTEKIWQRWLGGLLALYLMIMVLFSGTRGSFLGLLAASAALMVLIVVLKLWQKKIYRWLGTAGLVVLILFGAIIAFRNASIFKNSYLVKRFADISVQDNTAQTRLHSWLYGWQGFKDRWWLGYGPENFHVPFNKYFTADFYDYTGSEIWFDYAHSMLVETAATMGVGGLIGYLAIFISVIAAALSIRKKCDNKWQAHQIIAMIIAMVAIVVQNSFIFDSFNTYIVLFLILAWAASWQISGFQSIKLWPKFVSSSVAICLLIFVFYGLAVNVKASSAAKVVYQGYTANSDGNYEKALSLFDQARKLTKNQADPMILYSQTLFENLKSIKSQTDAEQLNQRFVTAEPLMLAAMASDSKSVSLRLVLSRFYITWGQLTQNLDYYEKAEQEAQKAVDFSPQRLHAIWQLVQAQLMLKKYQSADENILRAISLNPKQGQSYLLQFFLANELKQQERAIASAWQSLIMGYNVKSLPVVEDAILFALKHGVSTSSPELLTVVKKALSMGTEKQFILELSKEIPSD
jgi:O-antigen ligase